MGRSGYLILLALLVLGAGYVFWPETQAPSAPPLWRGEPPTRYRVIAGGLTQEVDGATVRVDGLERPLDRSRHETLWSFIRSLTIDERFATLVGEDRLGGYGLDAGRELVGDGQRLRWGGTGSERYVWDGRRLVPCTKEVAERFDAVTGRLDRALLLDLPPVRGVSVDGLTLRLDDGGWRDTLRAERPAFNRRINKLYDLLELLRLEDLTRRQAPLAPPLHQIRLRQDDPGAPERLVRLWRDGGGGLVQVDDLPVQTLTATALARWEAVIATFAGDYLFNLEAEFGLRPLGEIRVTDADGLRFRLEKHGLNDVVAGRSQWDVVWPGGREAASETAAAAIAMAFDETAVHEPRRRQPGEQPPPGARRITFIFKVDQRTLELAIDGDRIWSPTHVATAIALPDLLRRLMPDDMLDHALTLRGAERVVKIQRQWHQGPHAGRAEVVAVASGAGTVEGAWRRTWPKDATGGISALAVDRLARAFCTARTHAVRLPTAADRAILAAPAFELDVRFAQVQVRLSNDHARLGDTTDQDLGFVFAPEGERWRAVEKESGISHLIDAELMDLLQAPLTDDLVLPLVASLVQRIEIIGNGDRYALVQRGEDWQVHMLDTTGRSVGEPQQADVVEVRRYLRLITGLRARRNDPTAGTFLQEQLSGSVSCAFSGGGDALARVTLGIGHPENGEFAVVVDGAGLRGMPGGRQFLAADQHAALLPPANRFVVAAAKTP
jgi:hypothetical protein